MTIRNRRNPSRPCPHLRLPGVSRSSPFTLTTSLVIPISPFSSSNGPTTITLTTRGLCPDSCVTVVWAGPKFVRPHRWGSWVIFCLFVCITTTPLVLPESFQISSHLFFCWYAATQLALQVQQERTQVVCSNRGARQRPTRGHSCNGPWT